MHRSGTISSELGFLPSVYPFPGPTHGSDMGLTRRMSDSKQLAGASVQSPSWERRCLRKHKRRIDDGGSSPKRRKLTGEGPYMPWGNPNPEPVQLMPSCSLPEAAPLYLASLSAQTCPEVEGSCMEIEAAQRRLQEIEERITLEDDEDEEDLDVDQTQNRPVLVMSDSLKEGLQQGLGDILPPTVAQSVSRSCMELVLWRPPEATLPRRLKESLERQRKQAACRHTPTSEQEPSAMLYCNPRPQGLAEEDMEL